MLNVVLGICKMMLPQASNVAPVVITSSTNKICLPAKACALFSAKLSATFCQRSVRCLRVCVSVKRLRIILLFNIGILVVLLIPSQITLAWLKPLLRSLSAKVLRHQYFYIK